MGAAPLHSIPEQGKDEKSLTQLKTQTELNNNKTVQPIKKTVKKKTYYIFKCLVYFNKIQNYKFNTEKLKKDKHFWSSCIVT